MCLLWLMILLSVECAVEYTDGQVIGSWRPTTNYASIRLVQCPRTRGQLWSCVPVTFCGSLETRSSRHYCYWDFTEPFVCCPQQVLSQPLIRKRCGLLYTADREGPYILRDQILGAAVGGIPLRTATSSPWMVAVGEQQEDGSLDWYCGGALLEADVVLTAAHCCTRRSPDVVRVGELDFSIPDEDDARPEDVTVDKIHIHPNYKPPKYYNDIAILKLSRHVEYNRYVRPICLPEPDWRKTFAGTPAVLTGWGYLSFGGERNPVLQEVSVTVFNNTDCMRAYSSPLVPRRNYPEGIISSQLCAGDPNGGKDACQGDSGGPLVVREGDVHILVGIVSSGIGCGNKAFPGVYSRVSSYVDWINSHLR
ncbi:venom protease-like [Cryptotermes secundus]|uniref:venom protease-like n=1 Tax=Cryptotermes secundus TaxID=105785 RepID=UPI000CD7ABEC|nr:venom protease-like [Cryptotermes secundus]XP_033607809.1 venom protease-like [Cryptotermes secundus]XP_033607810.1 venom protease-like [Cryptotermes secundus]